MAFRMFTAGLLVLLLILPETLIPPLTCIPMPAPFGLPAMNAGEITIYLLGGLACLSVAALCTFIVGNALWSRMTGR